jgi:hypothetical protein
MMTIMNVGRDRKSGLLSRAVMQPFAGNRKEESLEILPVKV